MVYGVLVPDSFGMLVELFFVSDFRFMGGEGGEAGGVRGESQLSFVGEFQDFASDKILGLGFENLKDDGVGIVWGEGFGLVVSEGDGTSAAESRGGKGAAPFQMDI